MGLACSEHWIERFQYKEAGSQLLLQAFLQRIVNNGGRIEREYGLGLLRTDLLGIWKILKYRAYFWRRRLIAGRRFANSVH